MIFMTSLQLTVVSAELQNQKAANQDVSNEKRHLQNEIIRIKSEHESSTEALLIEHRSSKADLSSKLEKMTEEFTKAQDDYDSHSNTLEQRKRELEQKVCDLEGCIVVLKDKNKTTTANLQKKIELVSYQMGSK